MIDVSDLDPAELLAALFNFSKQQGMGFLQHRGASPLSVEEARELLGTGMTLPAYFDYLHGRVMKVEINGKTLDPFLYDRDNGESAAWEVVRAVREASK